MTPEEKTRPDDAFRLVLIDDHPLRRESLARLLEGGTGNEGFAFKVVEAVVSHERTGLPEGVHLALLSLGGARAAESEAQRAAIEDLARRMPSGAPVVVLSDSGEAADVVAALRAGARGFLTTRMDPCVMFRALKFIIEGGAFFPPSALLDASDASANAGAGDCADIGFGPQAGAEALTSRQGEVLRLLRQGQSNKRIARELHMSESTVKVHIRQIMRKLGASNRTQAALCGLEATAADVVPAVASAKSLVAAVSAAGMQGALLAVD